MGSWRSLALRGAAAVLFGLLTLIWPNISLLVLVLLFGAYSLLDGAFLLVAAAANDPKSRRSPRVLLLQAGIGIITGIVTLVWPAITALALLYLIAAWAVITGALEVAAAFRLRKEISNEWLLAVAGGLSILLGFC